MYFIQYLLALITRRASIFYINNPDRKKLIFLILISPLVILAIFFIWYSIEYHNYSPTENDKIMADAVAHNNPSICKKIDLYMDEYGTATCLKDAAIISGNTIFCNEMDPKWGDRDYCLKKAMTTSGNFNSCKSLTTASDQIQCYWRLNQKLDTSICNNAKNQSDLNSCLEFAGIFSRYDKICDKYLKKFDDSYNGNKCLDIVKLSNWFNKEHCINSSSFKKCLINQCSNYYVKNDLLSGTYECFQDDAIRKKDYQMCILGGNLLDSFPFGSNRYFQLCDKLK